METNKQLQTLIGAILKKDYFKLEFGCKFRAIKEIVDGAGYGIVISDEVSLMNSKGGHSEVKTSFIFFEKDKLFEILGQEPTLNDVLLAIEIKTKDIPLDLHTRIGNKSLDIEMWDYEPNQCLVKDYDLEKSIFNQEESVKVAIINLLEDK